VISPFGAVVNTTIENNICYENAQSNSGSSQCIRYVSCDNCTGTIKNNLWFGTVNSLIFSLSDGQDPPPGVIVSGTTNMNPSFRNGPATVPASPDFHLNAGSPAINLGSNLTSLGITIDYAGIARPASGAWDVGAHEFSNGSTSLAAPQGLRVN